MKTCLAKHCSEGEKGQQEQKNDKIKKAKNIYSLLF